MYLDRLRGPSGERLTYEREGSCCAFETPNSPLGGGALDIYVVSLPGTTRRWTLYLNMYDPPEDELRAPAGLTLASGSR